MPAHLRSTTMLLRSIVAAVLTSALLIPAFASDRQDDVNRLDNAARIFHEIMATPDKGIPQEILEGAQCIAVIPGQKKFALGIGGSYGKGVVTCRHGAGWTAPLFITVGGGSWGLQLGGASTDVVMVIRNRQGVESLLSDKFKIGADANAAAGPVGRHASAATDVKLNSQILTYSRSKGAFAGVSLDGSVVQPDESGNEAMYGQNVNRHQILNGSVAVPVAARPLIRALESYSVTATPSGQTSRRKKGTS